MLVKSSIVIFREYEAEGSVGRATDLSSLACSTDSEEYFDYLNDWGPRFSKLAQMYKAKSSTDSDRESSISGMNSPIAVKPFSTYARPDSPDSDTNSDEFKPIAKPKDLPDAPRFPKDPPAYVNPIPQQTYPKDVHTSSDDDDDYENTVIHRPRPSRSPSPDQHPYDKVLSPRATNNKQQPDPNPYTKISLSVSDDQNVPQKSTEPYYDNVPSEANGNNDPYYSLPPPREGEPSDDDYYNYIPQKRSSRSSLTSSNSSSSSAKISEIFVSNTKDSIYVNDPRQNGGLYQNASGTGGLQGVDNYAYIHPGGDSPREGRKSSSLESEV